MVFMSMIFVHIFTKSNFKNLFPRCRPFFYFLLHSWSPENSQLKLMASISKAKRSKTVFSFRNIIDGWRCYYFGRDKTVLLISTSNVLLISGKICDNSYLNLTRIIQATWAKSWNVKSFLRSQQIDGASSGWRKVLLISFTSRDWWERWIWKGGFKNSFNFRILSQLVHNILNTVVISIEMNGKTFSLGWLIFFDSLLNLNILIYTSFQETSKFYSLTKNPVVIMHLNTTK